MAAGRSAPIQASAWTPLYNPPPIRADRSIGDTFKASPVACFTWEPGDDPLEIDFDASCSSAPGVTIIAYHWDFGDGNTDDDPGPTYTHTYGALDAYVVSLVLETSVGFSSPFLVLVDLSLGVPGLDAQWDASNFPSITLAGSDVNQLDDLSGGGYHVTPPSTGLRPVYPGTSIGGRQTIDYATDVLRTASGVLGLGTTHSLLAVFVGRMAGSSATVYLMTSGTLTNDNGWYLRWESTGGGGFRGTIGGDEGGNNVIAAHAFSTAPFCVAYVLNRATSSREKWLYVNGVLGDSDSYSPGSATGPGSRVHLGGGQLGANPFGSLNGDFAEARIYRRNSADFTATEVEGVCDALMTKWGV